MRVRITAILSSFILIFGLAQPVLADVIDESYQTVLIPIVFSPFQILEGANGTRWTGEIWVHNGSQSPIHSTQPLGPCTVFCGPQMEPGDFQQQSGLVSNQHDGGALLHLPAAGADQIFVQARLLELTRNSQPTGVELPIVREGDFFTGPVSILAIPAGIDVRSALRVYDPRRMTNSAVRVEFLDPAGEVLATRELRPGDDAVVPPGGTPGFPPAHPKVARLLDITMDFPQLNALDRFHVRITPLTPGMEYWAMVSVTDNVTQHVLLVTAQ